MHAGAGLQFDAGAHLGFLLEAAVEHYPGVPAPFENTLFVPSIGAQARW